MRKSWQRSDEKKDADRVIANYKKTEKLRVNCPSLFRRNLNYNFHG
jgi:hypothetical protein